jgi:hypothetical protein
MGRASRVLACVIVAGGLVACRKPSCRGELSERDLHALQALGPEACSELTRTTVKVDDDGFLLDGLRVHAVFPPTKKVPVAPLDALLAPLRDNWKAVHPGQPFAGTAALDVPAEADVGPGVSVANALAQIGYRHLDVRSGTLSASVDWWLRGAEDSGRSIVHVESDPKTRGFVVRFSGPAAARTGARHDVADRAAVDPVITGEWPDRPAGAKRALVVRAQTGTFHDLLDLALSLRALPPLAGADLALEIGPPTR